MNNSEHANEIGWVGEPWRDPTSKRRAKTHYRSFKKGLLTVKLDDFVLISNDDSSEPESLDFCFVGKVLDFYEKDDKDSPYWCRVQWYSRIHDLPPHLQQQIQDSDYAQELVLDYRNTWSRDVDAETIFQICKVFKIPKEVPANVDIPDFLDGQRCFFCRHAYDGRALLDASPQKATAEIKPKDQSPRLTRFRSRESHGGTKVPLTNGAIKNCLTLVLNNDEYQDKSVDNIRRKELRISEPKHKLMALKENDIDSLIDTPTKIGLQPTPVKSFYSSEKKWKCLEAIDAGKVRRALPFDAPLQELSEPKVKTGDRSTPFRTTLVRIKDSPCESDLKSKDKSSSVIRSIRIREKPKRRNKCEVPSEKKYAKFLFLSNKKSEITPYGKIHVTRSGRKVSMPKYSEYWEDYSVSANGLRKNKRINFVPNSDNESEEHSTGYEENENEESDSSNSSTTENEPKTPKTNRKTKKIGTSLRKKLKGTPSSIVRRRKTKHETPKTPLEEARANLHVSAIPDTLPCRENEFSDIFTFVEGKLVEKQGGCMYISGVPGTGKTATVHEVMRSLEESRDLGHLPPFKFIEINALRLTNPHQCYVHFLKALTGTEATADHALDLLTRHFEEGRNKQMTILVLDELDMLYTKRQDVLYNMFQWPHLPHSCLIVLAIANTMDLPERLLANRVASRLGLTRMTFQPYSFKQLQEIIMSRIEGLCAFNPDAVQLVARKVASVSGDARRALHICRRATELVSAETKSRAKKSEDYLVGMKHVDFAIQEMFCSSKISAIRNVSLQEQLFLRAVIADFLSSGVEETNFRSATKQHSTLCRLEGVPVLSNSKLLSICSQLYDTRLLLMENGKADVYQRIKLNVSIDDVNYALKEK